MDVLALSRIQFGDTAAFHILWPLMSIGFALYIFGMEVMWLYTGKESYYRQVRFWTKIFVLTFAIGVASGFPLSFEFGTNWAAFSAAAGSFLGNILGFESTVAFTLETASLGILVFGWGRVPRVVHLLSNFGVLVGASLSGFWIMVANSWMQAPEGVHMEGGIVVVDNYATAIFNANALVSFAHMWVACVESTLFIVAGIAACMLLKKAGESREFFLDAFKYCLVLMVLITPLQMALGDASGLVVAREQPEKLAAMELNWQTNALGHGAPEALLAWPARAGGSNAFAITIPDGLSLLATHSKVGTVQGLNSFAADDEPTLAESVFVFYAFRLMVAIGVALFCLMLLGLVQWWRGALALEKVSSHRIFLWLWICALPLGFVATEAGWIVREVGRQPWVIYHVMRTADGLSSNLSAPVVGGSLVVITLAYLALSVLFIYFTQRIVRRGPELTSPLP